jgi:transposase-like protein
MRHVARKADGRRIFTADFKRKQIDRVRRGELTLAELSRKLGIARSLLHRWKRLMPEEGQIPGPTKERATMTNGLRAAEYIRELQLLLGRQTMELELLRAELEALKKRPRLLGASGR